MTAGWILLLVLFAWATAALGVCMVIHGGGRKPWPPFRQWYPCTLSARELWHH